MAYIQRLIILLALYCANAFAYVENNIPRANPNVSGSVAAIIRYQHVGTWSAVGDSPQEVCNLVGDKWGGSLSFYGMPETPYPTVGVCSGGPPDVRVGVTYVCPSGYRTDIWGYDEKLGGSYLSCTPNATCSASADSIHLPNNNNNYVCHFSGNSNSGAYCLFKYGGASVSSPGDNGGLAYVYDPIGQRCDPPDWVPPKEPDPDPDPDPDPNNPDPPNPPDPPEPPASEPGGGGGGGGDNEPDPENPGGSTGGDNGPGMGGGDDGDGGGSGSESGSGDGSGDDDEAPKKCPDGYRTEIVNGVVFCMQRDDDEGEGGGHGDGSGNGSGDGDGNGSGSGSGSGNSDGEGTVGPGGTGTDPGLPGRGTLYEPKYPDGLQGVWDQRWPQVKGSGLAQLANNLMPGFNGGTCPAWQLDFSLSQSWDFGAHELAPPCWIWDALRALVLVGAVILSRKIIFGG